MDNDTGERCCNEQAGEIGQQVIHAGHPSRLMQHDLDENTEDKQWKKYAQHRHTGKAELHQGSQHHERDDVEKLAPGQINHLPLHQGHPGDRYHGHQQACPEKPLHARRNDRHPLLLPACRGRIFPI